MKRGEFIRAAVGAGCAGLFGGCVIFRDDLRYRSSGELHRDFHASILDGYLYVRDNYGAEAVREVVAAYARGVYRTMHMKLKDGDSSELLAFWRYYLAREGGDYGLEEMPDGTATLVVRTCPALAHLKRRNVTGGEGLCEMTRFFNEELTRGTPFEIVTTCGAGGCRQVLRKREGAV